MSGKYLLDTNIIVALFANDLSILTAANQAKEVLIPSIVVGELYYGAYKSQKQQINVARVNYFVETNGVLECDSETAHWYGKIKRALHVKGRPIPDNDIWIAGLAFQHTLTLVTRDKHFQEIPDLDFMAW
jgi:tRNA(fMet)-specific endonuclease VapC